MSIVHAHTNTHNTQSHPRDEIPFDNGLYKLLNRKMYFPKIDRQIYREQFYFMKVRIKV